MKLNPKDRCPHCGCHPEKDLEENIKSIQSCANCSADLKLNGGWTGFGHKTMVSMCQKYGVDTIKATMLKLKLEKL